MHFACGARSSQEIIPRWLGAAAATLLVLLAAECATRPPAAGGAAGVAEWSNTALVETRSGWIRGRRDADCTWSWKGIPYAAPPVGDLRWRAPRDPLPWQGVREAARFGPEPVQYTSSGNGIKGSEDCLYLDVRRPRDGEAGLPVYVYIHGGGNSAGSSHADPECRGSRLAVRSRVVFVAVEYRVGPLGWFAHPALREGVSREDDSGNFGTLDLVKALQWIQGNIEAFGGDPQTVLIAGASGGGANVLSLMASPLADGLFHRAFVQSALTYTTSLGDAEAQAEEGVRLLLRRELADRSAGETSRGAAALAPADLRAYLRSKCAKEILACYPPGILGMIDAHPLLRDGFVLPNEGLPALEGKVPCGSVPVIIGGTHDELSIFVAVDGTWDWESRQ